MNLNHKDIPVNPYLVALGLLLVFVGIRIHLILAFGSQTPYWDDWAMGTRMAMYMESGLDHTWLYSLANEHRSTFSKLTNLGFFILNDHQWDPYVTMVLDALLWGLIGLFMIYLGVRHRTQLSAWLFCGLVILLWSYPISMFNTLSTVQTYLYYMMTFVVLGFWLLTSKPFSLKWSLGILCVAAACMTTGGGSFAPVAVTAVSCFLAIFDQQQRRSHLITAAVSSVFAVFGLYLILSQNPPGMVGAKSMSDFFTSLFKTLSWPASHRTWPSVIFLLPIGLLALGIAIKRIPNSRITSFTLMMAAFGVMLCIAIAHARGEQGSGPADRYFDFLTIYLLSSALSLMLIQGRILPSGSKLVNSITLLWFLAFLMAIPYITGVTHFILNDRAKLVPVQDDIMARYSVSSDQTLFENRVFRQVPFPFPDILAAMMERLHNADALPYSLQARKINLDVNDNSFIKNGLIRPDLDLYRGVEDVLGSFNRLSGAQNAKGEYTSEVIVAERPYVMIPVTGHLGFDRTSLSLVGENNGKVVNVKPQSFPIRKLREWREVIVEAPDTEYRLVAKDESRHLWFAFAAPRSVGRISYYVDRIIENGDKIWLYGLVLLVIGFRRPITQLVARRAPVAVN